MDRVVRSNQPPAAHRCTDPIWNVSRSSKSKEAIEGGLRREILSIVLITNRPGVYDVAMHSLAQQSSARYELMVVDAILNERGEPARKEAAEALARELDVNLAAVVRDKPKTRAKDSKYGLCNAYRAQHHAVGSHDLEPAACAEASRRASAPSIGARACGCAQALGNGHVTDPHSGDTGAMVSSGHVITILMDLTWYSTSTPTRNNIYSTTTSNMRCCTACAGRTSRRLPPDFVERTLRFYESVSPNPYAVLAYLEAHYDPPLDEVSRERLADNTSMTLFHEPLRQAPSQLGWKWSEYVHHAAQIASP